MNKRRKLIVALGAGALAAPFGSFAQQQGKVWRAGFIGFIRRPASLDTHFIGAFPRGMRELGYVEGKNLVIEWRWADSNAERLSGIAAELASLQVDVIITASAPSTRAAQKATSTIPIVTLSDPDPIANGFVASLARPGGNITGLSTIGVDLGPKLLEMLRSVVPKLSRLALLMDADSPAAQARLTNVQAASRTIGVTTVGIEARSPQEIENAFSKMVREKFGGVIVASGPFLNQQVRQISELAVKHRLPTAGGIREYAEAGGLMSYGASLTDMCRRGATYVDKIFKGAKPADLPVEQPTKFELFINRKTAKALGLKIPYSLQIMTDKVIE